MGTDHHLETPVAGVPQPSGCGSEFVTVESAEAERTVKRNFVTGSPEKSPYRKAQATTENVPERDIDCGDDMACVAGLASRSQKPVKKFADGLSVE
jgi:hypothetical protein